MPNTLREDAARLYQQGKLVDAINCQLEVVHQNRNSPDISDYLQVCFILYELKDYPSIIYFMTEASKIWPDDYNLTKNFGTCYNRLGNHDKAKEYLEKALTINNADPALYDSLTFNSYHLKQYNEAAYYGEKSLTIKDAIYTSSPISIQQRDNSNTSSEDKANIISFSLWGSSERYLNSAIKNAQLTPFVYPGWRCRFYCDQTVPEATRGELLAAGAEIIMMPEQQILHEGLFWRFLVANDPTINRFLVRDADSLINARERLAVDEWISSDKDFHIMRDWWTHTDLILAGMWGGKANRLPSLQHHWMPYLISKTRTANCDQLFLAEIVWPAIRDECLIHDRLFNALNARKFPSNCQLPGKQHIGQSAHVIDSKIGSLITAVAVKSQWQIRKQIVFTITTGRSGTTFLTKLLKLNLDNAEVHHERLSYLGNGNDSPNLSHFTTFNTVGNHLKVRQFWKQKLAAIRYGKFPVYAELSHFLSKAGLLENINYIDPSTRIDIINLRRNIFDTAWSYANRFEFTNNGYTWLFSLDPAYRKNIVNYMPYKEYAAFGSCVWYVHEMNARSEYYRHILRDNHNIIFHDVDLTDIDQPMGAASLLSDLGHSANTSSIKLPTKQNASEHWHYDDSIRELLKDIIAKTDQDPKQAALEYINKGFRIG